MSKILKFSLGCGVASFLASCAAPPASATNTASAKVGKRIEKVKTTAYTHTEKGGARNAIGKRLATGGVRSAASDWSRYPLGTRFRIADTDQEYVIDDYGSALIGTNTIDLYKTSRPAMHRWGVRRVDIEILQWGSEDESLKVLRPRKGSRLVRRMIEGLESKEI
jgi:3D (Asp-Asp-Asp) domain-containing protein